MGVIGAGVVGLFVAYQLARRGRVVAVFESSSKPGQGVSASQSEVIHVVQLPFNSVKSRLARLGNPMYDELCRVLGVPMKRLPAILVVRSWTSLVPLLFGYLYLKFRLGAAFKVWFAGRRKLLSIEESLSKDVVAGIVVEGYGVLDSKALVSRLYESIKRSVEFHFDCEVLGGTPHGHGYTLNTSCGEYHCRCVVNAAGLHSDEVAQRLGVNCGNITPAMGVMVEYANMDVNTIVAPFSLRQEARTKGGGIIPTTRGTVIIGPNFRVVGRKDDHEITEDDVAQLEQKFLPLVNQRGTRLRVYGGVRPVSPSGDFIVSEAHSGTLINLVGIESPGLTAAPALAELVADKVEAALQQYKTSPML